MPVDMFLKIDSIPGESKDNKNKDSIVIESFSWGETQTAQPGGGGQVFLQDLAFTKRMDKASPKLALACANGTAIPDAVLTCRKAGEQYQSKDAFLKIKLYDIIVSGYHTSAVAEGEEPVPVDQVSFNYSKIEWSYQQQDHQGDAVGSPEEARISQPGGLV